MTRTMIATESAFSAAQSSGRGLRRRSLLVMVVWYIVTLHLYAFRWYVDTTRVLNQYAPAKISRRFMALCMGLTLLNFVLACGSRATGSWLDTPFAIRSILNSAEWVLWLIWSLRLRWRLNLLADHPEQHAQRVFVWLFQLFYLQLKINALVDEKEMRATRPVWFTRQHAVEPGGAARR